MRTCTMFCLLQTGYGIVIGERQYLDPGRGGAGHQVSGCQ
jgi:hypothetical protein